MDPLIIIIVSNTIELDSPEIAGNHELPEKPYQDGSLATFQLDQHGER